MIQTIIGYFSILLLAFSLSNRKKFLLLENPKPVLMGILTQIIIAFALTNIPAIVDFIEIISNGVMVLRDATLEGTKFVFGFIGGGNLPFEVKDENSLFVFAFQALPTIILVSILAATLTYLKILPFLSRIIGSFFRFIFGIKDSVGTISAAKIFVGQFEAPLLVKHRLSSMKDYEIFIIMSLAFSTTSAAVMPIYAGAISDVCPNAINHIIISSVVCVISTLVICSIMFPRDKKTSLEQPENQLEKPYNNIMDAIIKGTSDGANVWWCIVGSLIGMVALITLINYVLSSIPFINTAESTITLQKIFGFIMYPFTWICGISSADAWKISELLGTKFVINEVVAFFDLAKLSISTHSATVAVYLLNNFGNFACLGITIGGLTAICPSQKENIIKLGAKSFIAGSLATFLTACIMNVFL